MGIGSPFNKSTSKKKSRFGNTSYFNRGSSGTTGAGMSTFSRPTTRPDSPEGGGTPSTTIVPPPSPQVNLGRGTRYFKTPTPPAPPVTITNTGGVGKVNPPAPPVTPPVTPTVTAPPSYQYTTQLPSYLTADILNPILNTIQTSGGINAFGTITNQRSLFEPIVRMMREGQIAVPNLMRALGLSEDGWSYGRGQFKGAAREQAFYRALTEYLQYAHSDALNPAATTTNADEWMIPAPQMSQQLLANEGLRNRYLQQWSQITGRTLSMDQFMTILRSTDPTIMRIFEQMHEQLRSKPGTGGTRPSTGGVGG